MKAGSDSPGVGGEHPEFDAQWERYLTGTDRSMVRGRRMFKVIPSSPRCKMCNAPFAGIGHPLMCVMGREPSTLNPRFCNMCEKYAAEHPGGVEMELTFFFADIRGSTPWQSRLEPQISGSSSTGSSVRQMRS